MKVAIGSDHAGFELKEKLKEFLQANGYHFEDFGTNSEESADYPEYAKKVSEAVISGFEFGILICGSGIGMSIAANKFPGIRAAFCMNHALAVASREHNNANILTLAARFTTDIEAKKIVKAFLETKFSNEERHIKRLKKLAEIENIFQARK
ncbi:MAG: ribose 5-phosphate isomerase B [Candidatus Aenigmatarchaeota archaeon]